MSQTEFKKALREILRDAGLEATHGQTAAVFKDLWPAIVRHTEDNGGTFAVKDFGTFKIEDKPARTGRNPRTGAQVKIPAKTVFRFKSRVVV